MEVTPRMRKSFLIGLVLVSLVAGYVLMLTFASPRPLPEQPTRSLETITNELSRSLYLTSHLDYRCKDPVVFGGNGELGSEGSWPICMDFWRGTPDCEIYSFGILNDFSFDDRINEKYGCRVYSFDPSMSDKSHHRGPKKEFLQEGLFGVKSDNHKNLGWKVDTLKGFMDRFNTSRVDYLKIDIEYSEWSALDVALEDGSLAEVDQIGFEVHFWADGRDEPGLNKIQIIKRWNDVFDRLYKAGFRMWYSHTNPDSTWQTFEGLKIPCCFEIIYVNMKQKSSQ